MSDFDDVLERLLTDPGFAAALAADPAAALVGYRLGPDEAALLHSQVTGDTGGHSSVEARANQSSTFGMLAPLADMIDLPGLVDLPGLGDRRGPGAGFPTAGPGGGLATGGGGFATGGGGFATAPVAGVGQHIGPGVAPVGSAAFLPVAAVEGFGGIAATEGFGGIAATEGFGGIPATRGFGPVAAGGAAGADGVARAGGVAGGPVGIDDAEGGAIGGFGAAPVDNFRGEQGFGAAPPDGLVGDQGFGAPGGLAAVEGFGAADTGPGRAQVAASAADPPAGYRTRVDVDGDGQWDRHSVRGATDGGVDILVDLDRNGRADFVGHDVDADGLVDSARFDRDGDGWFETRSFDDDRDGWLDRRD